MPALKVHHTATVDEPWDGPAAVAAMPSDDAVLRYCHAWQTQDAADADHKSDDDDVDDQKSSYKFPHHKSKGGPANLAACRNGLARLSSADIPDGDKDGVKAHLQAHLDDADDSAKENRMRGRFAAGALTGGLLALHGADRMLALSGMNAEQRARAGYPRARRISDSTDWFRITDAAAPGEAARLELFDEIGWWGVTASDFTAQLAAVNADQLHVHINSPGGDVFDGLAILNTLRAHPAKVHVIVDGLAASAASFIAMAGDTVTVMPGAMMMIHDAAGACYGNGQDMTDMAKLLDLVSDNIAGIYAARSGTDAADWRAAMRAETWYTAEQAVDAGLADKVGPAPTATAAAPSVPAASDRWDLSLYSGPSAPQAPPEPVPELAAPTAAPEPARITVQAFRDALKGAHIQ